MIRIPLRDRHRSVIAVALVDDCDAFVAEMRWYRDKDGYAVRHAWREGKRILLGMHILIMRPSGGLEVDHIDGNRLDNRRANLRLVDGFQQAQNRKADSGARSAYRGVTWSTASNKWEARVQVHGRRYCLGFFDDELRAAEVASEFRERMMTHTNEKRSGVGQ